MAMSTYWQVSATVSKNHNGSRQFTYARRDMSKYDEANAEINRLREANKAAAPPVTKIETEVVEKQSYPFVYLV